jgi:hypothetical protein
MAPIFAIAKIGELLSEASQVDFLWRGRYEFNSPKCCTTSPGGGNEKIEEAAESYGGSCGKGTDANKIELAIAFYQILNLITRFYALKKRV